MRRSVVASAIAIVFSLIAPASADTSVQREVTSLVQRGAALANENFESIRKADRNGQAYDVYDIPSLKSPDLGWCVLGDGLDARTLFCHIRGRGALNATVAYYLPAIRRGLPTLYKKVDCPAGSQRGPSYCEAWSTSGPRHTLILALILQGDGGRYVVNLDFRNKL